MGVELGGKVGGRVLDFEKLELKERIEGELDEKNECKQTLGY